MASGSDSRKSLSELDADVQVRREGEHRAPWATSATLSGKAGIFFGLTLRALGVVYGDIGTSPLYVFSTLFSQRAPLSERDFIGACSAVIWSLLFFVSLKYAVFILIASNEGEGGVFAIGSLLTGQRSSLPRWAKRVVLAMMLVGAGLLLGDGAFTPAVSVLGAVGGLAVAYSGFSTYIVVICVVIIVLLFLAQPYGTSKIGVAFGPVIVVWFFVLAATGIWRITEAPQVLRAFNPVLGLQYVFQHGSHGFFSLASIFLAVTGLEALYADIGHFSAWPIRVGWFCIALPALVLQYLGQTALLVNDPSKISNPFFKAVPDWAYWPQLLLATMAAVIASQAMISASFSIASQATRLGLAPPVLIKHTSRTIRGQLYVPSVNFILLLLTVAIVAGFGTDVDINNAYGFTVCTTMIFTTLLFAMVIAFVWKLHWSLSALFLMVFIIPDAVYWAALLSKVPEGGWVALLIALGFFVILLCWYIGERSLKQFIRHNYSGTEVSQLCTRLHLRSPVGAQLTPAAENNSSSTESGNVRLSSIPSGRGAALAVDIRGDRELNIVRVPGMWVFSASASRVAKTPYTFEAFLERSQSLPEVIVFLRFVPMFRAYVPPDRRIAITPHEGNIFTVLLHVGFAETNLSILTLLDEAMKQGLARVDRHAITLILGSESIIVGKSQHWYQWAWRWPLLVYEHLKHVFRSTTPTGVHFEPRNTIAVGILCEL